MTIDIFPVTLGLLPSQYRAELESIAADKLLETIETLVEASGVPEYLADLAKVERALHHVQSQELSASAPVTTIQINPTLNLIEVGWLPLLALLEGQRVDLERAPQMLLFWRHLQTGEIRHKVAGAQDLLALKVVAEDLDPLAVAQATAQPVGTIDSALEQAVHKGLLLAPPSTLRRTEACFPITQQIPEKFLQAEVFTLQWHITHRCDLHCRHCYDRSTRSDVELQNGIEILDQLRAFCLQNHVGGQVSFSGGNPFLHPQFFELYQAARDRNLNLAVLGNPVSEAKLDRMLSIAEPVFYQVSLEGLQPHNDEIRGKGNFAAVMNFLELLKRKGIFSIVMLTLTRGNMDQVLPLTEELRDRVDLFTYNRLSMVGEGAHLESPPAEEYQTFVQEYLNAKNDNSMLAIKDSLINIERETRGQELFGGCTGFGCGAAFNFVSLLPDGEVHACRKFPSLIGNIQHQNLGDIYASEAAQAYRRGCQECTPCHLRPICGGCLAVAYGWRVDPLKVKDPACFLSSGRRR
jgi:selenobiotic family peptide radical SAM maturase